MNHKEWASPDIRTFLTTICAALMIVFCGQIFGQAGIDVGSITGTVKDPTGALVQKAQCTLTNTNTGVTQKAITTTAGDYVFSIVPVGTYSLKVEASGFKDSVIDGIVVHLGSVVTQDISLQVGAASAEVTVTSAAPLLQAQDASLGTTIDTAAATELPLFGGSAGRSFMSLITTAAGVQFTGNNSSTGTYMVHGTNNGAIDIRVNGADDNAEVFGGITIPPIPDTIQEMKVETGNNPTEVGHSYGATVNVVTKQGTNQFKGEAWEYNENDMFSANDYFNKRNQLLHTPTPLPNRPGRLKENSFGAVFGGPVILPGYNGHNKTFFTVDFQYTYYTAEPSYTGTIPTATMQSSNFTNLVDTLNLSNVTKIDGLGRTFQQGTILDPATTRAIPCGSTDPVTGITAGCASSAVGVITDSLINGGAKSAVVRDPYFQELGQPAGCPSLTGTLVWTSTVAGGPVPASCFNHLPAGRMDPNAVKLLQLFKPYPYNNVNINPATGLSTTGINSYASNFYELLPQPINTKQYDVRLDHVFSDKDSMFVTWSKYNQTNQEQPPYAGPLEGGSSVSFWTTNPDYMVVVTETHVFNPHLINEYRMSDEHNWQTRMDPGTIDNTFGTPASFGIPGIPQNVNNGGLPTFNVNSSISSFGSRTNVTWQKVGAWQFSDNLTKIVGKHEWKFGAEYWWTYGNIAQLPNSRGSFTYGQYANVPASGDNGTGMADFLLTPTAATGAYANTYSQSTTAVPLGGVNAYAGDNWNKSIYHAPYISFYAVDNWKITPALTATLGIRDDYFGPYYSAGGSSGEGNFWMGGNGDVASGSAYYLNAAGCSTTTSTNFKALLAYDNIPIICEPNNAVNKVPMFNWAPRLGFAYRVRPNLVVRAGGGVSYGAFDSEGYGSTLGTNYPFRVSVQQGPQYSYRPQLVSNSSTTNAVATMESTFGIVDMTSALNAYQPVGSVALYGKAYHYHTPYTETLDSAVQWQFTGHDSVEVRYVGVLGKQLDNLNPYHNAPRQALPSSVAALTPCTAVQLAANPFCENSPLMPDGTTTIPFPNLSANSGAQQTEQISNYESGEAEYQHQFAGGFNMDANYTFARCWSDGQGGEQNTAGPGNGRAPWIVGFGGYRADYDKCSNQAAQVFKLSGEYGIPLGKGARWAGSANQIEDAIIGGWKLDPIWISESGTLVNVTCQGTVGGVASNAGFTGPWFQTGSTAWSCNAPLVSGVNLYKPGPADAARTKVTGFWNSAAFTAPPVGVASTGQQDFTPFGVRGNQIYGPGWYDVDLSIHKQFKVFEQTKLEIGAMAIDAFNHVHLGNPSASGYTKPVETTTSGWGTITGDNSISNSGRIWQFVGKFFF
jgi:hypothetical protein